jgi:WD40 repeat protein
MLKSKAFSQEIYKIQFSFYQPDVLATMGTGHIKFWKIAETFTGLKLKGQIAKFGTQEISDVITCYHFSDGKILSSTEYGNMLLWEGNLIKCVIGLSEDKGVHDGAVESIFKEDNYIVTTGRDGMIKYWSYSEIDNCEPDDNINYFPKLQCEIYLGGSLVDLQRIDDRWIIHDKLGTLSLMDAFSAKVIATIDQDNKNEA